MSELDLNQIETIAQNLRAVSDETYSAAVAVADVYNVTSAYDIGDYCIKSTLLYKCNTAIPSGEVWNSNHWDEICISDELNDIRSSVIHVGTSAPSNPNVQLWLDTDEPGMSSVSSVNGATGTVVLDADDVGAMAEWTLLWANASPSSGFNAQTISLDLSQYKWILVSLRHWSDNTARTIWIVENNNTIHVCTAPNNTFAANPARNITANDTGVTFSSGYNAQNATDNGAIPVTIHGIKGVTT